MKIKTLIILGCFITGFFQLSHAQNTNPEEKGACPILEISGTHVDCHGENNGSATVSITDGSGNYTVEWSNGVSGTNTINNLTAGYYHVDVSDNVTGCSKSAFIYITQPQALTSTLSITDVECYGEATGSIETQIAGGTMPYTTNWSNGTETPNNYNLPVGDYSIEITDSKGCQTDNSATITQPAQAVDMSSSLTEVLCRDDANGGIDIDVWGGTTPYTYSWNGGAYASQDLSGIPAGSYDLSITDANGCTFTESFLLNNPPALEVTSSVTENLCYGINAGEIELFVSGGTGEYSYEWSNDDYVLGFNTPIVENLPNNHYFVTVNDANGCEIQDDFIISSPEELVLNISGSHVSYSGGSDGEIDLEISGGAEPYTYNWSNGATTQDLTNIQAGNYEVTISDANNCSATSSMQIFEPLQPLTFSFIKNDASCYGASDGSIFAYASGGTEPYFYNWSTGSTVSYIHGIPAGTYILNITDANNVEYTDTIVVEQPEPISFTHEKTPPSCNGFSDGSIQISVNGGTQPYSFKWFDDEFALAGSSQNLSNIKAGNYTVQVKDSLGCTNENSFNLSQPTSMELNLLPNHVECAGDAAGAVESLVTGGTPPYSYEWSNGSQSSAVENLPSGDYSLTVEDANACFVQSNVFISEASPIEIELHPTPTGCIDKTDGSVSTTVTGGNGGYEYLWSNGNTDEAIYDLAGGDYSLTVTDILGCNGEASTYVERSGEGCISIPNTFSPNADGINDTWVIENIELYPECSMQIFNKWGNLIFESKSYAENWDGTFNGSALPSGTYFYILNFPQKEEIFKGSITIVK